MNRRDFLATGMGLAHLLAARRLGASPSAARAAIVIGVDKAGNLPALNAAAAGARQAATWLEGEGFEVYSFVKPPIKGQAIKERVFSLVKRGTLEQLILYFSGHGFLVGGSEMWLLSDAPHDPNEAISLLESVDLARRCSGIPNVVFISDACRSAPHTMQAQQIRGMVIFPSDRLNSPVHPEIDRFLAAGPGDPAFEAPVEATSKMYEGLYTASFLEAFKKPTKEMVKAVGGVDVVPNRRLKKYLLADVSERAHARNIPMGQLPDAIIESGEDTYIGRVVGAPPLTALPPPPPPTPAELAQVKLRDAGLSALDGGSRILDPLQVSKVSKDVRFDEKREAIVRSPGLATFETQTGFSITGARVTSVTCSAPMTAVIVGQGDGANVPAMVRVVPQNQPAGSVLLRFADGSATVVAALNGYVGGLVVENGRVSSLNYTPARNSVRWNVADEQRLAVLRATVATAVGLGGFRIEGNREARARRSAALADSIRVDKGVDPSLGVYAAYAYAEAGLDSQVRSVVSHMRANLEADLFDVAMLAGDLARGAKPTQAPVPFCPMLSQGWSWLRVRDVQLAPALERARNHLLPSIWTTFSPEGATLISNFMAPRNV